MFRAGGDYSGFLPQEGPSQTAPPPPMRGGGGRIWDERSMGQPGGGSPWMSKFGGGGQMRPQGGGKPEAPGMHGALRDAIKALLMRGRGGIGQAPNGNPQFGAGAGDFRYKPSRRWEPGNDGGVNPKDGFLGSPGAGLAPPMRGGAPMIARGNPMTPPGGDMRGMPVGPDDAMGGKLLSRGGW